MKKFMFEMQSFIQLSDLMMFSSWFMYFNAMLILFNSIYLLMDKYKLMNKKFNLFTYSFSSYMFLFTVNFASCFYFFFIMKYYFYFFDNFYILANNLNKSSIWLNDQIFSFKLVEFSPYYADVFMFTVSKFSLLFIGLFCFLYPIICALMTNDFGMTHFRMYMSMQIIFFLSYILVLADNVILFYFIYETMLMLVFATMYLTSNSRGGVEATLFFAGWAVLGSILVGVGIIILIGLTNLYSFSLINFHKLTSSEIYYIYILLFFGFGTKLSVWPFWYWLPKAHVEVSTGMSIFLSCILIKLSYFCLFSFQFVLASEISLNICLLVAFISVLDITMRLMNLSDLKAVIAYSSVLHTNLLMALAHLDNLKILNSTILYVWGHSFATATLFISVNLIESSYGSRNIIYVSGLWYTSPTIAYMTVWSLLSFMEFPLTLFFWGEMWLWNILFFNFPLLALQMIFFCSVIFMSIFFKLWWGVIFGVADKNSTVMNNTTYKEYYFFMIWLLMLQIVLGVQPSCLTSLVGFIL